LKPAVSLVGRPIDGLTLAERLDSAGRWVALEIYTPETLPVRQIAAEGSSSGECAARLNEQGLDPANYEFQVLRPPY